MTRILWVWEDTVPTDWPAGYDTVMVKAFDGKATRNSAGFSWEDNFLAWSQWFGMEKVAAWGVAYKQDGDLLGADMALPLARAPWVVLDIEDWGGQAWTDAELTAVVHGFTSRLPGKGVGYSSYPTRAQCAAHGINQALLDELCDFSMPQVYYDYQAAQLATVWADHRHPHVTVSPANYGHWDTLALDVERKTGVVAFWRMGVAGWEQWGQDVPAGLPPAPPPGPAHDPLRPTGGGAWPQGRFVAWDGKYWALTDGIWFRPLTEGMAQGLAWDGVAVHLWPHCRVEAVEAK